MRKEREMKRLIAAVLVSGALLVSGAANHALAEAEGEATEGKQLFESNCKRCHTIDRPKSKRKTKEAWTTTVMRMKNTNGCPITNEEAQKIIDYLSQEYGPEEAK